MKYKKGNKLVCNSYNTSANNVKVELKKPNMKYPYYVIQDNNGVEYVIHVDTNGEISARQV